eukprot:gene2668-2968_t
MNEVVFVLVLWLCKVAVAQADRTAYVESKAELVAALNEHSVTTIVLTDSFSTAHNHSALHDPVIVRRNLTLQPLPGKNVLLDLDFADGLLKLCSTCTLKIYNLTVANDRRGTGPGYDAILGDPGSRVISQHVERLRLACTPPTLPFKNINGTRRSASFPHADKPQLLSILNYTFGGKAYPQSLVYRDVSIEIPYSMNEGRSFVGGYSLHALSDVLLCQHFVSDACLDRKPGLLLAGAAFVVWRQRKQLKVLRAGYQAAAPAASSGGHKGKDADASSGKTASYTASPKAPHYGWQLHSSLISPLVGAVQDTTLEFGDLLGSGSFGRVFKGCWAGRTVAIKVIEHSSDTIAAVENEIRLMFSFNHQNLNANNVLVSTGGAAAGSAAVAKVADLGLARVMDHNRTHLTTSTLGTMNHMPPEQLQGGQLSPAGDIYAFGIMLYELYTGTTAFRKLQHMGQFYETVVLHNLRPLVPQQMPADLRLLMEHCWATDPASRPSADRVVECLRAMVQDRQQKLVVGVATQRSNLNTTAAGGSAGDDVVRIGSLDMQQLQQRPSRFRAAASGFKQSVLRQTAGSSFERSSSAAGSIASSKNRSILWRFGSRNSSMFAGSAGTSSGFGGPAAGLGYRTFDYPFSSPRSADDTAFDPHKAQMAAEDQAVLSRVPPGEPGYHPGATAAEVRSWSQKPWLLSKERDVSERSWRLSSLRSSSGNNSTSKGHTGMWDLTVQGSRPDVVLDVGYIDGALLICPTCTLTIRNLTLKAERRGAGQRLDAVVGQLGSKVLLRNVIRLRVACSPLHIALASLRTLPRSATFPDPGQGQQAVIRDVNWNSSQNDTRLCHNIVPQACLDRKNVDDCIDDLIDIATAGQLHDEAAASLVASQAAGAASTSTSAARLAAIVVPVVVAAVVVGLLAFMLARCRHKARWAGRDAMAPKSKPGSRPSSRPGGIPGISHSDSDSSQQQFGYTLSPVGVRKGWQLHSSLTSPLVGPVQDPTIEFGDLLGSGSFGRVFKGRWAGRTVAIKVIEHSSDTIAAVENEIRLMFSFNHQNLVHALHCITFMSPRGSAGTSDAHSIARLSIDNMAASNQNASCSIGSTPKPANLTSLASVGSTLVPSGPGQQQSTKQSQSDNTNGGSSTPEQSIGLKGSASGPAGGEGSGVFSSTGRSSGHQRMGHVTSSTRRAETRLVLEYCDFGTLRSYVSQRWNPQEQPQENKQDQQQQQLRVGAQSANVPEDLLQLLMLLHGAAQGLEVLHSNAVVHGDLTANNVLVSSSATHPAGAVAKVADLGLARVMDASRTHRTTHTLGTMNHMPPEQLRSGQLSPAGDIYAFGIMLYELYTGTTAFRKLQHVGQFYETVVLHNLRPLVPQQMPADLRLLMEHCWATDPASRPSADRVVECLRAMVQDRQQKLVASVFSSRSNVLPSIGVPPQQPQEITVLPDMPQDLMMHEAPVHQQPLQQLGGPGPSPPSPNLPPRPSLISSPPLSSSAYWRPGAKQGASGRPPSSVSWRPSNRYISSSSNVMTFDNISSQTEGLGFEGFDSYVPTGTLFKQATFDTAYSPNSPAGCGDYSDTLMAVGAASGSLLSSGHLVGMSGRQQRGGVPGGMSAAQSAQSSTGAAEARVAINADAGAGRYRIGLRSCMNPPASKPSNIWFV